MKEKLRAKKIFAILLSFALALQMGLTAFPQVVSANEEEKVTFDVKYSATELKRGNEITVNVDMPENNGQALDAELQYDTEKLEVVSKKSGEGLSGTNGDSPFSDVTNSKGKVKLVAALLSVDTHFKGGEILEVTFKVKDTAKTGKVNIQFVVNDLVYESKTEVEGQLASHSIKGVVAQKDVMIVVPLTGLVLDKSSVSLNKGETVTLTLEKQPTDATANKIVWTSSDPTIASVKDGVVTALKSGKTEIVATCDGVKSQVCTVSVTTPLKGIEIVGKTDEIKKGENTTLTVSYNPEDADVTGKVEWSSSDSKIAEVKDGVVTAKKEGTVIITAKLGTFTDNYSITVKEIHLAEIQTAKSVEVVKGKTTQLTVKYLPEDTTDNKAVTWSSNNEDVATVSAEGIITAKKAGIAEITAIVGSLTSVTVVTVTEIPITEVAFEKESLEILIGQKADVSGSLSIKPENTTDEKKVVWSSSDETVAVVDEKGIITAKNKGTAIITATVGSFTAELKVIVTNIPLESIAFDKVIEKMEVGETKTLGVIYNPENTTDEKTVKWASSDDSIIKVENGILTALKAGNATITATSNGKEVSCVIVVNEPKVDKPETDKPETDKPETDKPEADKPETDKPETDKPEADKPEADKPETDKSETDKPEADKPETDKSETDKPNTDNSEDESPKTADNDYEIVYLALAIGSLGGIYILWAYKRREMYR